MLNIRHNVFETNSSSSHSIAINPTTDGMYDTIVPDTDGTITLTGGCFGRTWDRFNDPFTKANYIATSFVIENQDGLDILANVICAHTGAKFVQININLDYQDENYSYIDHQSQRDFTNEFMDVDYLKEFIFSPNSWLFIADDGNYSPPNFYDVDPNIVYTHQLSMRGKSQKFISFPSHEKIKECIRRLLQDDDEFGYCGDKWQLTSYQDHVDGQKITSWDKLDQGIITAYICESVYASNGDYKGFKTLDYEEFEFELKEI